MLHQVNSGNVRLVHVR